MSHEKESQISVITPTANPEFFKSISTGQNYFNFLIALAKEEWAPGKKVVFGLYPEIYVEITQEKE